MDKKKTAVHTTELLKIHNLSTGYKLSRSKIITLHNSLTLNVLQGELIAMIGPNGAGKSTIINTLIGMLPALGGDVLYNNKSISVMAKKEIARLISVVLTDKIDDKYLTAYDIVGTGRYPHGSFTGKLTVEDKKIISNSFNVVGASKLSNRTFYSLSDGEKQKILLARAIAQDTPLIILDEPTAFIDSPGKILIMSLLKELVLKYNKTIILTTHDTELAMEYADKLWLVGKNGYFTDGEPQKLINSGLINNLFKQDGVIFNKEKRRFEKEI